MKMKIPDRSRESSPPISTRGRARDREIQLDLPLKQIAAALREGVGSLMRQAGLELMQLVMEDEVHQLAGAQPRTVCPAAHKAPPARHSVARIEKGFDFRGG